MKSLRIRDLHGWKEICEIIGQGPLERLKRSPVLQSLYDSHFRTAMLAHYDSLTNCILARLDWNNVCIPEKRFSLLTKDAPKGLFRVVQNEWPYTS